MLVKPWGFDEFCGYTSESGLGHMPRGVKYMKWHEMHQKIWGSSRLKSLKGVSLFQIVFQLFCFGTFREPFVKKSPAVPVEVSGDGGALGDHGSASGSLFDSGSVSRFYVSAGSGSGDGPWKKGVSENSVPHCTQWLMILIPIQWLFHWEYTLFSDKPKCRWKFIRGARRCSGVIQFSGYIHFSPIATSRTAGVHIFLPRNPKDEKD